MSEIILLTSKNCPNCPAMKQLLRENKIDFENVDIDSKRFENLQLDLLRNGIYIMYVPTIIQKDGEHYKEVKPKDII